MRDRIQIEIAGEEPEARRIMASRRPVTVKSNKNGRTIIIRSRDILIAEVVTAAEERAMAEEAAAKAEAERKVNPHPGREPKFALPGGRRT
ncbi:MAG: hypothetical protein MUP28_05285 [Candidatus Aminicenantes bacterium]|nr:hypothetical protein [Candidatus Aminicenantes bacterium]